MACCCRRRFRPATAERQDVIPSCPCRLPLKENIKTIEWVGATPRPCSGRRVDARSMNDGPHAVASVLVELNCVRLAAHVPGAIHAVQDCTSAVGRSRFRCRSAGYATAHRGGSRGYCYEAESNREPFQGLPWRKRRESNPLPSDYKSDALPIELLFPRSPIKSARHTPCNG